MSQVIDRGPAFSQVIDRTRQGLANPYSQVIDRGPAFSQVIDRTRQGLLDPRSQVIDRGRSFGDGYTFGSPAVAPKGGPFGMNIAGDPNSDNEGPGVGGPDTGGHPGAGPAAAPATDPFEDWYKNVIQANPNKYDTNRSKAQWQAWYPLWDPSSQGFKSSKVDVNGNPIEGNAFEHPDACPPGMAAYGQNACAPVGYHAAGGGGGNGGFDGSGYGGFGGWTPGAGSGWTGWPTGVDETNDPGYQFRLKQGRGALEASAAARGVLNTGGTLQGILQQGQDYASSEFGNVWNRARDKYQTAWDAYRFAQDEKFRQAQLQQYYDQMAANAAQG